LPDAAKDSSSEYFYVEMACNEMFGNGKGGMINPPDPHRSFTLSAAQIVIADLLVMIQKSLFNVSY